MAEENSEKLFAHNQGDSNFLARVDCVFSALGALEKKHEITADQNDQSGEPDVDSSTVISSDPLSCFSKKDRCPTSDVQTEPVVASTSTITPSLTTTGKHSLKRKPPKVPDHVLHPEKWKKYSLEEDGTEQLTAKGDALNRNIALNFLNELAERKTYHDSDDGRAVKDSDEENNFVFKRPEEKVAIPVTKETEDEVTINPNLVTTGAINKMATYEVGLKVKKANDKRKLDTIPEKGAKLSLSHLDQTEGLEESSFDNVKSNSSSRNTMDVDSNFEQEGNLVTFKSKRRNRAGVRARADDSDPD